MVVPNGPPGRPLNHPTPSSAMPPTAETSAQALDRFVSALDLAMTEASGPEQLLRLEEGEQPDDADDRPERDVQEHQEAGDDACDPSPVGTGDDADHAHQIHHHHDQHHPDPRLV